MLGNTGVTADNWTEGVWGQFDSSLGTVPEAEKQAMKMADYVVTEAGFGADLGAEKFLDIKCRMAGIKASQ